MLSPFGCVSGRAVLRAGAAAFAGLLAGPSPSLAQCDGWLRSGSESHPLSGAAFAVAPWTPPGASTPSLYIGGQVAAQGVNYANIVRWTGSSWEALGGGVNDLVLALLAADPDGSGPLPTQLIVGGRFSSAGAVAANHVARWDGTSWFPLGGGFTDADVEAFALADPDGPGPLGVQPIAAGGGRVSRWTGSLWADFFPLFRGYNGTLPSVHGMTVWDSDGAGPFPGQLVVAGSFVDDGGTTLNSIAMWTGIGWVALGAGLTSGGLPGDVLALTTWDPDGSGPLNPVLVAGGLFDSAGGVPANGVAYWNGVSWHAMNTGSAGTSNTYVAGLTTWDPDGAGAQPAKLVAHGHIYENGAQVNSPAAWDGASWQPLGVTLDGATAITTWDPDGAGAGTDELVAAGLTPTSVPDGRIDGVAKLTTHGWAPIGLRPFVLSSTTMGNRLVVGGKFDYLAGTSGNAHNIAFWDGANTTALGSGASSFVRALKSYHTSGPLGRDILIAGGDFTSIGNVNAQHIAQYDEQDIVNPWSALGQGLNDRVFAVERFNNQTYAAGQFTASGGTGLNYVARWNATSGAWESLSIGLDSIAYSLKVYNGALYVGGNFTSAGGVTTGGLARWNGSSWSAVAGNFGGWVYGMEVYNNELVLVGQFPGVAGSPNIARFNGSTLAAFGTGGADQTVYAAAAGADGKLYVGGDFSTVGGVPASHIARWTGSAWQAVRGGVDSQVATLTPFHNEIEAGGALASAAGGTLISPGWARYSEDGVPWVVTPPHNVTARCIGATAAFTVTPANGYSVAYQWRKEGAPIADGPTPWGSIIHGSTAVLMYIESTASQDAGQYDCVVSTCGSVTSAGAALTVCYANCDCSSALPILNVQDFSCFLTRFASGDAYANCDGSTQAPVLNVQDFSCYLQRFAVGCP